MTKLQTCMLNLVKSREHLLDPDQKAAVKRIELAKSRDLRDGEIKALNALNTFVQ